MYIRQVTIKNYRNFGDPPFVMDLRPFTLILGENNVGKTNLLAALRMIFGQEIVSVRRRLLDQDDINYATIQGFKCQVADPQVPAAKVKFPEVCIETILSDLTEEQQAVAGEWFTTKELTEAKLTYCFVPKPGFDRVEFVEKQRPAVKSAREVDFPIDEYAFSIFGGNDPGNECNPYFLSMFKMEHLDALRDAQRELVASGDYRLLYRVLRQRDGTQYGDIKRILDQLQSAVDQNQNLTEVKDEVTRLLNRVSLKMESTENAVSFEFSSPDTYEMLKKVSMAYGTDPITVERNGLGRNNLLYISLVLSHLAEREGRDRQTYFRVIGIEEPEAHLHPLLEDHLARNIEEIRAEHDTTMQLLVTSHSTHIAARLSLENTAVMFRDRTRNRISSHYVLAGLDPIQDRPTVHYLSKYIDATKSRLFFARKAILVEGIAEQLLIPMFFELHSGHSLEQEGCSIINVAGVAFRHFLKVIQNGFFVRCIVLTDSDSDTATAERAEDLKKEFDQANLIEVEVTTSTTFETEIIEANADGSGKDILIKALKATRPHLGAQLAARLGAAAIDPASFFDIIKDYKTEFALNLLAEINSARKGAFQVPTYICRGFEFLLEQS